MVLRHAMCLPRLRSAGRQLTGAQRRRGRGSTSVGTRVPDSVPHICAAPGSPRAWPLDSDTRKHCRARHPLQPSGAAAGRPASAAHGGEQPADRAVGGRHARRIVAEVDAPRVRARAAPLRPAVREIDGYVAGPAVRARERERDSVRERERERGKKESEKGRERERE